jgi:serine protease Do
MLKVVQIKVTIPQDPNSYRLQGWWGSASLISATGRLLSAYHVLHAPEEATIEAIFQSGEKFLVNVVKLDRSHDLALGQLVVSDPKQRFLYFRLAEKSPRPGDFVAAVGNPFALGISYTAGVLSATGRVVELQLEDVVVGKRRFKIYTWIRQGFIGSDTVSIPDMLQFDAPINPGNSGGALLNLAGELVGQTNAGISGDGVGFAVSLSTIKKFLGTSWRN